MPTIKALSTRKGKKEGASRNIVKIDVNIGNHPSVATLHCSGHEATQPLNWMLERDAQVFAQNNEEVTR